MSDFGYCGNDIDMQENNDLFIHQWPVVSEKVKRRLWLSCFRRWKTPEKLNYILFDKIVKLFTKITLLDHRDHDHKTNIVFLNVFAYFTRRWMSKLKWFDLSWYRQLVVIRSALKQLSIRSFFRLIKTGAI